MEPITIKQKMEREGTLEKIAARLELEPEITRTRLAAKICAELSLMDHKGAPQIGSCLKALGELESKGVLKLPPPKAGYGKYGRMRRMEGADLTPSGVPSRVEEITDLSLTLVSSKDEQRMRIHNELLIRDHPQGANHVVGRQVRYLVESGHGYLGAVSFGSSALRLEAREHFIGWNEEQRMRHQNDVINMSRFLIVNKVTCKNLASRVLSMVVKRIGADYEMLYGYRPLLIESFVDTPQFLGTCYQAANFKKIGQTKGRGRNDRGHRKSKSVKDIYVYALDDDFRKKMGIAHEPEQGIKPLFGFAGVKEENWAEQEFGGAELGDLRLSRRLVKIAEQKGSLQGASYSRAAGGVRLDIKQYYYFIDLKKEQVTFDAILSPHRSCTIRRMAGMDTVLVVQDTTDINYTKIRECEGLGPIGTNQSKSEARGLSLHTCFAFSEEGLPLGIVNASCEPPQWPTVKVSESERRKIPIEEKVSYKWVKSYLDCVEVAKTLPDTKMISVMDREADIFELYEHVIRTRNKVKVIVRARHDRCLSDSSYKLWKDVEINGCGFEVDVEIPAQRNRMDKKTKKVIDYLPERTARLHVRYKKVHLNTPVNLRKPDQKEVVLYGVHATEENPPEGAVKIDWMFLTSLSVTTDEEALQCLRYYKKRWGIETWHRVLKTGSGIEKYRLKNAERLKRALAIDMVISWRVMFLTLLARITPNADASEFFDKDEYEVLERIGKKKLNSEKL
jgi:hypothetical protein